MLIFEERKTNPCSAVQCNQHDYCYYIFSALQSALLHNTVHTPSSRVFLLRKICFPCQFIPHDERASLITQPVKVICNVFSIVFITQFHYDGNLQQRAFLFHNILLLKVYFRLI